MSCHSFCTGSANQTKTATGRYAPNRPALCGTGWILCCITAACWYPSYLFLLLCSPSRQVSSGKSFLRRNRHRLLRPRGRYTPARNGFCAPRRSLLEATTNPRPDLKALATLEQLVCSLFIPPLRSGNPISSSGWNLGTGLEIGKDLETIKRLCLAHSWSYSWTQLPMKGVALYPEQAKVAYSLSDPCLLLRFRFL